MMSTLGIELTNFLDPDLTWKTVPKGSRRRTRKPVSRNLTVGVELAADKSTQRVEDTTVSESEKLGVAVLGRRFSDKIEHVPIKKRKFMFRSPSPPCRTPSPRLKVSRRLVDIQHASDQGCRPNSNDMHQSKATDASIATEVTSGVVDGKISEVTTGKLGHREDFSGIEILAAAACNNNMIDYVDHAEENLKNMVVEVSTQEGIDSLVSEMPVEGTVAAMETANLSPKNQVPEDELEDLSSHGNSVDVSQKFPSSKDNRAVEKSVPWPDDRSLWDLNTTIDAWEQPCDILSVDSQSDIIVNESEELQILQGCEIQKDAKDIDCDNVDRVVSTGVQEDIPLPSDLGGLPPETCGLNCEEHKLEACSSLDRNLNECVPTLDDNTQEPLMCAVTVAKASDQVVGLDSCFDHSPCPGSDNITSTGLSKGNENTSLSSVSIEQKIQDCSSGQQLGKILGVECVQVEKSDVASPYVPVLERIACEADCAIPREDGEDSGGALGLRNDRNSPQETMSVDSWQPVAPDLLCVEPVSSAAEPECEGNSALAEPEELLHKSSGNFTGVGPANSLGKVNIEDPSDDNYDDLDVSQEDKVHIAEMEKPMELQAGYDSQFEDGELRESNVNFWEETEGEGEEVEQVDYESESEEERLLDLEAENNDKMETKVARGSSPGSDVIQKIELCTTGVVLRDHSESSNTITSELTDGRKLMKHTIDCLDEPDGKEIPSTMIGFRASKRELPSCIEGSLSSEALQRSRYDNLDNSHLQAERGVGSDKFTGGDRYASQMLGRSAVSGHFVNSSAGYWDSKRRHSPYHRDSYGSRRPRPKSVIESRGYETASNHAIPEAAEVTGLDNHLRKQFLSSSSNGMYRPLIRRRSLADRDDAYSMHTGMVPLRDISPDRSSLRRYPQGCSRGPREEYHRPIPDDSNGYSDRMPHRLPGRERSISPLSGGRPHYTLPYKKSRSRSRSRSPITWLLPRERSEGSRHRSRSPDFRSDARTDRTRLVFQKRLPADYEEGFLSPPRNRFSPQRKSRWFDDRNPELDNFRDRKSPVRMFRQNQRVDSVRSIRRLNSDDYFRPMIHSRRYQDMADAGRGFNYEVSDNCRRKPGNRYEMIHKVRRYDTDGVVRQFRYGADGSFVASNS